jgi:hypothetical protein
LRIACFVISLDQTLEIKQDETCSLLKDLKIGKRKISYRIMQGLTILHIIKVDEDVHNFVK